MCKSIKFTLFFSKCYYLSTNDSFYTFKFILYNIKIEILALRNIFCKIAIKN